MEMAADDGTKRGLTTTEVAELLGVKRQTVYAYVSRGILHRRMAMDGRTSIFDPSEVQELRLGRRPEQEGLMRTMLTTRLTRVSDDGLWVRGRDLNAMVTAGAGYIDVANLLWDAPEQESWATAPTAEETDAVNAFSGNGANPGPDPESRDAVLGRMRLLDQLRLLVALESSRDPLRYDLSPKSVRAAGRRAITAMASNVGEDGKPRRGGDTSFGTLLWSRLSARRPTVAQRRALDVALALLADHGLASSTFAARIAASVRADPYSVIGAGLGALGGPLHGAASSMVHDLYIEAERRRDPAAVVGELQRRGGAVPGFGHTVYRSQDGRYSVLMSQIVEAWADDPRLQTVFRLRDVVGERSDAIPNIDLALGALTYLAGMSPHGGEAIFAISRTAGWLAHAMEEYEEKPLRLRPKARYIGEQVGE